MCHLRLIQDISHLPRRAHHLNISPEVGCPGPLSFCSLELISSNMSVLIVQIVQQVHFRYVVGQPNVLVTVYKTIFGISRLFHACLCYLRGALTSVPTCKHLCCPLLLSSSVKRGIFIKGHHLPNILLTEFCASTLMHNILR